MATGPSALLVSHGQPSEPEVAELELAQLCARVSPLLPDWTVASVTLASPGAIERALDIVGSAPLVFPVFMTDGWFTQTALPACFEGTKARFLRPLGVEPKLVDLATLWLRNILAERNWVASQTRLIVAAHGSGRSRNPSRDTRAFADEVQGSLGFADLRVGFVEEPPALADVLTDAGGQAICLPYFAARRGHVLNDLPEAIEASGFAGICLDPIGLHPDIPSLIADVILSGGGRQSAPI